MDLNYVKLTGFRRFENTTLKTWGNIIALVGPNESGKSSILEALQLLNSDSPYGKFDLTRDIDKTSNDPVIEAAFLLDDGDKTAISELVNENSVKWFYIRKQSSGRRNFSVDIEEQTTNNKVTEILKKRIPKFLFFNEQNRSLASFYNLSKNNKSEPNNALKNLLKLADFNIEKARQLIEDKKQAELRTLINQANQRLSKQYEGKWLQFKINPSIEIYDSTLRIFIQNENAELFEMQQRSDGLRQFIALVSFLEVENKSDTPSILLIDEAEIHLHYDAQAQLINIFSEQTLVSKIIYTTHSAGCLPKDLGTGVKLIVPEPDKERSTIKNSFWSNDSRPGILPLFTGMGGDTMTFITTRKCVLVEGGIDMLLLPTFFRQVYGLNSLEFQIIRGIAGTKNLGLLPFHSPQVAFLLDNDNEGKKYKKRLIDSGISEAKILKLPHSGKVLEDYIRKDLYLKAVNNEIKIRYNSSTQMNMDDILENNRPEGVKQWCKTNLGQDNRGKDKLVDKTAVAYHLLELANGENQEELVEPNLKDSLRELYRKIQESFSSN